MASISLRDDLAMTSSLNASAQQQVLGATRFLERAYAAVATGDLPQAIPNDAASFLLKQCFTFGRDTHRAVSALLTEGLALQALILCRPYFELATTCVWASRAPDGWVRSLNWMISEKEKQYRELRDEFPDDSDGAEATRRILEVLKAMKMNPTAAPATGERPDFQHVIREVHSADAVVAARSMTPKFEYASAFRELSGPTHGNALSFEFGAKPQEVRSLVAFLASANLSSLRALHFCAGYDIQEAAACFSHYSEERRTWA